MGAYGFEVRGLQGISTASEASTAVACALPGVFLVLRRTAMMSDAISHTVLLGIVIGFFITEDLA